MLIASIFGLRIRIVLSEGDVINWRCTILCARLYTSWVQTKKCASKSSSKASLMLPHIYVRRLRLSRAKSSSSKVSLMFPHIQARKVLLMLPHIQARRLHRRFLIFKLRPSSTPSYIQVQRLHWCFFISNFEPSTTAFPCHSSRVAWLVSFSSFSKKMTMMQLQLCLSKRKIVHIHEDNDGKALPLLLQEDTDSATSPLPLQEDDEGAIIPTIR